MLKRKENLDMSERNRPRWTDILQPLVVCQKSLLTTSQRQSEYLETLLVEAEDALETMGDMNQMDMLKLQDAMESQQRLLQMLSSIMKNMKDTMDAIVQNMK